MLNEHLQSTLNDLHQRNLHRSLRVVSSSQGREIVIDGRKVLNFCSNNYLGLAEDPRLIAAAMASLQSEGLGSGASRLVCGNLSSHRALEQKICELKGTPAALVYSSGYMANVGIISALFDRGDLIFSDRLNHASIVDGILLSGAEFKRYPHADMLALEEMLKKIPSGKKRVIITDSVFSMDGDIAPLDEIVKLAKTYHCSVMVDEAHALGVLGKSGKGAVEHFGLEGEVDIQMGTLSKAVGSFGAYVCGSQALKEFLVNKSRSLIYTTGLPPSVAAASMAGLDIIATQPQLRQTVMQKADYLRRGLQRLGFDTLKSQTPIIPVVLKDEKRCLEFSERLFNDGIYVTAIRPPTVPQYTARLRMTVMATHTQEELEKLLTSCAKIGRDLCLI